LPPPPPPPPLPPPHLPGNVPQKDQHGRLVI
jgi:hypothetical protein